MPRIEAILLIVALLFILSITASKASARLGIPALLLFAIIGMLAGSDGPGGIYFDHPWATQFVGVVALTLILFAAGFETDVRTIRPVLWQGISLATVAVVCSAVLVGLFSSFVLHLDVLGGLLLGAIVSSTDAAAVFSVLRSRGLRLQGNLKPLMELESGSNDPMAVMLTVMVIVLIVNPRATATGLVWMFFVQLGLGAVLGYLFGRAAVFVINGIKLEWEGLYPVLSVTMALLTYGATSMAGGNGFLAAYVAGLMMSRSNIIHRTTLRVFHDGLAWLVQIAMFLVLGLQVYPSRLPQVAGAGMAIALFLMFIARPVSVFIALPVRSIGMREKMLVSWGGLRGAAPIILATFPLLAGISESSLIFDVVFFVALTSLLLQGMTIPLVARKLGLEAPGFGRRGFPLLFNPATAADGDVFELQVSSGSRADGKRLMDLQLPEGVLIVLLNRENQFVVPQGGTVLRSGDTALVLADGPHRKAVTTTFSQPPESGATQQDAGHQSA